ncbi:MAG: hypothetical protein LBN04_05340 [Oscillospiraceae bacterium]|nr:hypothetical protein [Oscillospiraceae bacterium]
MKKISWLLIAALLLTTFGGALAEEPVAARFTSYEQTNAAITIIPATDAQPELGYLAGVTQILEVDGLQFKDLNGNGALDVYEDWRADVSERVADLYSQLTLEEKAGLFYHVNTCGNPQGVDFADSLYMFSTESTVPAENATFESRSMWYYINVLNITTHLDNTNGTPAQQITYHNAMQALGEDTRLGIPIVISNDRQYNAWGGMIDTAHDAFGAANDLELSKKLWTAYSLESRAVGIHVVLHPYSQELGSWNGEDPEYAGSMTKEEVAAIQVEGGVEACMKHFIARGGDSSFQDARSDAQTVDNWMTAWEIALESNPKWVMTNGYGTGLSNTVHVDYDKETMDYLRNTLGFEGIIVSDWGDQGDSNSGGTTVDGVEILSLTIPERYAFTINLGLDQIGAFAADYQSDGHGGQASRAAIEEALTLGLITEERAYETCYRVLKDKFDLGLFENPYSDAAYALSLSGSAEYIAEPWDVVDTDTLMAARNPEMVAMERQLQAESAILIKNEENLLPLAKGIKVYIDSTASAITLDGYKAVLPDYAELVDSIEAADVVIADCTQINDAAELIIDDAKDAGKKLVVIANTIDPDTYLIENADALLALTFSRGADHGTGAGGFITTTEPIVLAQLLFGDAEPAGMVVKEIARDSAANEAQWKDLAGDQGANGWVRMMLLATMKTSENNTVPNNWGDPLIQYQYSMKYDAEPAFVYEALVLPRATHEVVTESNGSTMTNYESFIETKAGEPFTVYALLWNNGDDGITTVQAKCDDTVIAEKIMAVNGGSWRVLEMELTIDEVGEHTLTVGDLTKTINIVE